MCWKRIGSPPIEGSKMPTRAKRSIASRRTVMATTGVPRIMTRLVAYCAHTNSGRRYQVVPGARIEGTGTMNFRTVRMDEKPLRKMPSPSANTDVQQNDALYGVQDLQQV